MNELEELRAVLSNTNLSEATEAQKIFCRVTTWILQSMEKDSDIGLIVVMANAKTGECKAQNINLSPVEMVDLLVDVTGIIAQEAMKHTVVTAPTTTTVQ